MAQRHKRVIIWDGDIGVAPDGTTYIINSEQIRGEPRQYWVEHLGRTLPHPTDNWAISRDKAIQAAEHHYRTRGDQTQPGPAPVHEREEQFVAAFSAGSAMMPSPDWISGHRAGVLEAIEEAEKVANSSSSHRIVDDILAALRNLA